MKIMIGAAMAKKDIYGDRTLTGAVTGQLDVREASGDLLDERADLADGEAA
jgi:hypothetical protein